MAKEKGSKLIEFVSYQCGLVGGILLLLMGFCVFYEVIFRSFGHPTIWTFEVSTILFLWGSLLGMNYTLREKAHVRVDMLVSHASWNVIKIINIVIFFLGMAYCSVLCWEGFKLVFRSIETGERNPSLLASPVWIVQAAIPVGCVLLILQMIVDILNPEKQQQRKTNERARSKADITVIALTILVFVGLFSTKYFMNLDKTLLFLILTILLLSFLLLGMPVCFTLGIVGTYGLYMLLGAKIGLGQIALIAWGSLDKFVLLAVPLFIMTGSVFMFSGLSHDLFNLASVWLRHFPGGLAIAAVFACALFAALTGSSVATAATIGLVSIPEMRKRGFDNRLALGTVAAGGTLGILIPPSIPMIVYGMITSQSVGTLFIAGVIPGIIISFFFAFYIFCKHRFREPSVTSLRPVSWNERFRQLRYSIWGLLGPVIILGGIYTGFFTPTEAAGVALFYSLFVWIFIYRRGNRSDFRDLILNTVMTNSMIMIIIIGAMLFGQIITFLHIPDKVINLVSDPTGAVVFNKYLILLLINMLLLFLGCFLEIISIMLITIPVIFPLIINLGFDPIWFGVILTINMELAAITPPVGLNLYVIMGVAKDELKNVVLGVVPFVIIMMISIALFTVFPFLVTCLLE